MFSEFQYGTQIGMFVREGLYTVEDTAVYYNMVYKESILQSGLITTINIDVEKVNRVFGIGIYRKVGTNTCDFMLENEVDVSRMADYQTHLQKHGLTQVGI